MHYSLSNETTTIAINSSYLYQVSQQVNTAISLCMLTIGLPGNLIAFCIFKRLIYSNKTNMGLLCSLQCTIDFFVIVWVQIATQHDNVLFDFILSQVNDPMCKLAIFLRRVGLQMSSWMAAITTFDRFMFVFYEHRFGFMKRKSVLIGIIISILCLNLLSCIPNLFYYLTESDICMSYFQILLISDIVSNLFRTYIPFALMLYFNIKMIRKLSRKPSNLAHAFTINHQMQGRKEQNFTFAVISFDVIFIVTHFPLSVINLLNDAVSYQFSDDSFESTPTAPGSYYSALVIALKVSYLDKTFSFFIYLAFNKIFRSELLRILGNFLPLERFLGRTNTSDSNGLTLNQN